MRGCIPKLLVNLRDYPCPGDGTLEVWKRNRVARTSDCACPERKSGSFGDPRIPKFLWKSVPKEVKIPILDHDAEVQQVGQSGAAPKLSATPQSPLELLAQ